MLNYRDHAKERGKPLPSEPLIFLKLPSAVAASGEPIFLPAGVGRVDHEADLAIASGRTARNLAVASAGEAILGYTCFNDVTAREVQDREIQYTAPKASILSLPWNHGSKRNWTRRISPSRGR